MAHSGSSCKSLLECPVCLEDLSSNEPRYLRCHHTVCTPCLGNLMDSHGGSEIACPTCRNLTPKPPGGVKELPVDFRILSIAEFFIQKPPAPLCSSCSGDRHAGAVCHTCAVWLCDPCRQRHDNIKMFHDHRVEKLSRTEDDSVGCTIHKKPVLYTCLQCEPCTDMCTVCVLNHEKTDHVNIVKLSDEITKQHTKLKDLKGSAKTKLEQIEEFLNKHQHMEQDISAHVEQMKRDIDEKANNIREELHSKSGYKNAKDVKEKLQDILNTTSDDIPVKQTSDQINTLKRLTDRLEEQLNDSANHEYRLPELNKYTLGIYSICSLFWKGSKNYENIFHFKKANPSAGTPKTGTLSKSSDGNKEDIFSTPTTNPYIFGTSFSAISSPQNKSSPSPSAGPFGTPASIAVSKSTNSKANIVQPFGTSNATLKGAASPVATVNLIGTPSTVAIPKSTTSSTIGSSFLGSSSVFGGPTPTSVPEITTSQVIEASLFGNCNSTAVPKSTSSVTGASLFGQPISTAVTKSTTSKATSVSPLGQPISKAVPKGKTSQATSVNPLDQPISTAVPKSKTPQASSVSPFGQPISTAVTMSTTSKAISVSPFGQPISTSVPVSTTSTVVGTDPLGCTGRTGAIPKSTTSSVIRSDQLDSFSLFCAPTSAADPKSTPSSIVSSDSFGTAISTAVPKTTSAPTNTIFGIPFTKTAFP